MEAPAVPLTAWEQAAIILLFITFLGGVFAFLRWVLEWTRKAQREAQDKWQAFVEKRDALWQSWMADQNRIERETMCNVTEALERLAEKLDQHDLRDEERINGAIEKIVTVKTRPRN